jgi:TolB-like protein/class 3 adenylate cyclase/Flp pilus assembly protein TadD
MEFATRQLAAIMFTDMVGYTALMQEDEDRALNNRARHRQVFEELVTKFNGKILQYYGDGTLSIFSSALFAVQSAMEIQQQLRQPPEISVRIGIHSGDVVYDKEGIYGDGVNVASRIESLSVPGGIFISEKVFDEIKNHTSIISKSLGLCELKNVKRPIEVFAIANEGFPVPDRSEIIGKTSYTGHRIAVLPFVNMSADPENEYFSDGITEEIITALTKVEGLLVTSRTSAFVFKGKNEDARKIGLQLNVSKILEGSVRKAGNRVRVTAQLVNAADGYHLWSDNFDGNLQDIFEVQDDISRKIANTLREKLTLDQKNETLVTSSTENMEAYSLYLKGLQYLNRLTPEDLEKAIGYYRDSIRLQPDFAPAYSSLANALGSMASMGRGDPMEYRRQAEAAGLKALSLDPTLGEAHAVRALGYCFFSYDMRMARAEIETAIRLNPGAAEVHRIAAMYFFVVGEHERALIESSLSIQLDPLNMQVKMVSNRVLARVGRFEEAIANSTAMLQINPDLRAVYATLGLNYFFLGDTPKAIEYLKEYQRRTGDPLSGQSLLGYVYAKTGMLKEANECIDKIKRRAQKESGNYADIELAPIYAALNRRSDVLKHLKNAIDGHAGAVLLNYAEQPFDNYRNDPEFRELFNFLYGK